MAIDGALALTVIVREAPKLAEGKIACAKAGAIPALVGAIEALAGDASVWMLCEALAYIINGRADKTYNRADESVAAGAPLALANVLRNHADNPRACAFACLALTNIAWGGEDSRPEACMAVKGMAELLVKTLRCFEGDHSAAPNATSAIQALCYSTAITPQSTCRRDTFVKEDAPAALVAVLQRHAESADAVDAPKVCQRVCETLEVLADTPIHKDMCASAGAIPELVRVLRARAANPGVVASACDALFSISHGSPTSRSAAVAAGAIPLLRDALLDHPKNGIVCLQAARALSNIVWTNEAHRDQAKEAGVVPLLVEVCTNHPGRTKKAAAVALEKLGFKDNGEETA